MTRPTELPEWATTDVNLPSGQGVNKVAPSLTLRQIGVDYLELPTAQEENAWRNNVYRWTGYNDERVNTLVTDLQTITDTVTTLETKVDEIDSVVDLNSAHVDIGDLRIVFTTIDLVVPNDIGSVASGTATLSPALASAPLQVQLTNRNVAEGGLEGTEILTGVAATSATTVTVDANRVIGSNVSGSEVLTVHIMAIGRKP